MLLFLLEKDLIWFKNQKTQKWKRYPYSKEYVSVCMRQATLGRPNLRFRTVMLIEVRVRLKDYPEHGMHHFESNG